MTVKQEYSLQAMRWMARRGMLELDLLFNQFIDSHFDQLNHDQIQSLVDMLKEQDPTLYDWFFSSKKPERSDWIELVKLIKQHSQSQSHD